MPIDMQALLRLPAGPALRTKFILRHAGMNATLAKRFFQGKSFTAPLRKWTAPLAAATLNDAQSTPDNAVEISDAEVKTQEEYISHCQQYYGIPGLVDITSGPGGLPFVTLHHPNGSQAQICLHGATVTSWKATDGTETLHLRNGNKFDGLQPIAGGIGVAWPQIGPGALPLHGLLRNMHWSIVETTAWEDSEDPCPSVSFYVDSTAEGAEEWPHGFEAVFSVTLHTPEPEVHPSEGPKALERDLENLSEDTKLAAIVRERQEAEEAEEMAEAAAAAAGVGGAPAPVMPTRSIEPDVPPPSVLRCSLQIHNNGTDEFKFTAGLLTHLKAEDVRENKKFVKVLGLGGKYALDYAADPMRPQLFIEQGDFVFFDPDSGKNVDKLYVDCDDDGHVLYCPGTQRHVEINHPRGFTDLEVLHPAASAPDVARRCVCLGSARKARPVTLAPSEQWCGEMVLTAYNNYWELPPFEKSDPTTVPVPKREEALPPRRAGLGAEEFAYTDEELQQ